MIHLSLHVTLYVCLSDIYVLKLPILNDYLIPLSQKLWYLDY